MPSARFWTRTAAPRRSHVEAASELVSESLNSGPAVESQLTSPASGSVASGYRPALDGIRAVAVVAVIVYHLGYPWLPGGFLGVDVFFVLSGYLITGLLLQEKARSGRVSYPQFWARRARRLLPALLLVLLAVEVGVHVWSPVATWQARRDDVVAAVFYYPNWHFISTGASYFSATTTPSPLKHFWSLGVEEQFYICWPLLLAMGFYLCRGRWRWLVATAVAASATSALLMAALYDPESPDRAYQGTDTRASQLLAGAALALTIGRNRRAISERLLSLVAFVGATGLLLAFLLIGERDPKYYRGGAIAVALCAVGLIWGVESAPRLPVGRLLALAPLRWTGRVSYGLYLWHWPVIVLLPLGAWIPTAPSAAINALRIAVTMSAAALSYVIVERPVRQRRPGWLVGSPRRLAVGATVAGGLVLVAAVPLTAREHAPPAARQVVNADQYHCPDAVEICVRRQGGPGRPIVALAGDSTALSLDPAMVALAQRYDWTLVSAARNGCGIAGLTSVGIPALAHGFRDCSKTALRRRSELAAWKPDLIVVFSRWEIGPYELAQGGSVAPGTARWAKGVGDGLESFGAAFSEQQTRIAFLKVLPPGSSDPRCPTHPSLAACRTGIRDHMTDALNRLYERAVLALPGAAVIDLAPDLCPGGTCPPVRDGVFVRADGTHFSVDGSRWLAPRLFRALVAAHLLDSQGGVVRKG